MRRIKKYVKSLISIKNNDKNGGSGTDQKHFNPQWYLAINSDVRQSGIDPWLHYDKYGRFEGRLPSPASSASQASMAKAATQKEQHSRSNVVVNNEGFDPEWYLATNNDVRQSGIDPWFHYDNYGRFEGRLPAPASGAFQTSVAETSTLKNLDPDSNLVLQSGYFDPEWYLNRYPDLDPSYMGALEHYMKHGAFEGRAPGPHFNSDWYLAQNSDIHRGKMNPLLHYLRSGLKEGRKPAPPLGTLEVLMKTLDTIDDLESQLIDPALRRELNYLPIVDSLPRDPVYLAMMDFLRALNNLPECIVFLPWLVHGGADLVAVNITKLLSRKHGFDKILLVAVDFDRLDAIEWLPSEIQIISLPVLVPNLSFIQKVALIEDLIRVIRPASVININSHATWECYCTRGFVLNRHTKIFGAAFCRDYDGRGIANGYIDTHLRDSLVFLDGIITDNEAIVKDICEQLFVPTALIEKFVVLRQPIVSNDVMRVQDTNEIFQRPEEISLPRFRILWASRFASQKNIGLLKRISKELPLDMEIDIWGRGSDTDEQDIAEFCEKTPQCNFRGSYPRFSAIQAQSYDAFLYTSLWDGIPNVLLEAAAAGLPIVASDIGGISELVSSARGWPVDAVNAELEYIQCLKEIQSNTVKRKEKLDAMNTYLNQAHSLESFSCAVSQLTNDFGLSNVLR